MIYVFDFGSTNAGGSPSFVLFSNLETGAPLTPPVITEVGSGLYRFEYVPVVPVIYRAVLNGVELSDVLQPAASSDLGGANALGRFPTAGEILNRVASELSLEEVSDPYSSADPIFVQLRRLLQTAGEGLLDLQFWPQFNKQAGIYTVEGQTRYSVPYDFRGILNQTGWNRTENRPLVGPVTSVLWQRLQSSDGATFNVVFRQTPMEFIVYPAPPAGLHLSYEYSSCWWVQEVGHTAPNTSKPSSSDDTVLFPEHLLTRALKLKYLNAKGFDSSSAQLEYALALSSAGGRAGGAPKLSLGGQRPHNGAVAVNGEFVYL